MATMKAATPIVRAGGSSEVWGTAGSLSTSGDGCEFRHHGLLVPRSKGLPS